MGVRENAPYSRKTDLKRQTPKPLQSPETPWRIPSVMKPFGAIKPWRAFGISRVFRALFYSTEALTSPSPRTDTLYQRISKLGNPKISLTPVLDQWLEEGRPINSSELHKIIKQLRKYRRFSQALQVYIYI